MHEAAAIHEGGEAAASCMLTDSEWGLSMEIISPNRAWLDFFGGDSRARAALAQCIARCGGKGAIGIIALQLCDDDTMRVFNKTYCGKDSPTNVLAFPDTAPCGGNIALGMETMLREAAARGIPPADHMIHLLVHAMLHLLGHTHDDDDAAMAMESIETEILAAIGIADPYGDERSMQ